MTKALLPLTAAALLFASGCAQDANNTTYTSANDASYAYQPGTKQHDKQRDAKADPAAMMAEMERLGKVGSHHNILTSFVGNWECQTKIWCPLQSEPIESRGTMSVKALNDGRFVQADYKGTASMPGPDGKMKDMPFSGTKVWGYSNADNEYQAIWTDNMSTSMVWMTGPADSDSATVTLTGTCKGPDDAGKIVKHTTTEKIKMLSSDKYVSELWTAAPGETKHKVMEITYTRLNGAQTQP